jgi:hypothetical protein
MAPPLTTDTNKTVTTERARNVLTCRMGGCELLAHGDLPGPRGSSRSSPAS